MCSAKTLAAGVRLPWHMASLERASGTPPAGSSTDADGSDAETVEETVEAELVELYRQQKLAALEEELRRLEED